MRNFLSVLTGLYLMAAAGTVNAAIINMGNFQLDDATGLEWLDLSITSSDTVESAVATYSGDGWMLATEDQFHTMYSNYDGDATDNAVFGNTEGYINDATFGTETANTLAATDQNYWGPLTLQFFDDFGQTGGFPQNNQGSSIVFSVGLYSDSNDSTIMRLGGLQSDVNVSDGIGGDSLINYYDYSVDYTTTTDVDGWGVFLVRGSSNPDPCDNNPPGQGGCPPDPTSVPEPSIIALFAAGLFGLGFARRRKA